MYFLFKLMFLQHHLIFYLMKLLELLPHINQDCLLFYFMVFWTNPINYRLFFKRKYH